MSGWVRAAAVAAAVVAVVVLVLLAAFAALAAVALHRMAEYNGMFSTVRTPRCLISNVYPELKTGDIVLFVAATHAPTNSVITQTFHSHAGILLRDGDLVSVSEAQPALELMPGPAGDRCMRPGADVLPLLVRLKYYTGVYYVLRLSRPLDAAREAALKREAERLRRECHPYPSKLESALGLLGRRTGGRHCFQHVAHLLDVAGLTPAGRAGPLGDAGFGAVCREVCGLPGAALPDGYAYRPPVQILYDIDAEPVGAPPGAPPPGAAPPGAAKAGAAPPGAAKAGAPPGAAAPA